MSRRCIHIPNGIICVSRGSKKGPSKKDMAAVADLVRAIRAGKVLSLASDTPSVVIDPRGPGPVKVTPIKMKNALIQSAWVEREARMAEARAALAEARVFVKDIAPEVAQKNLELRWQAVHAKDPKRQLYRDALKDAVKCDRVTELAFTPSGLLISGKCWRVVNKAGRKASLGFYQVLAP